MCWNKKGGCYNAGGLEPFLTLWGHYDGFLKLRVGKKEKGDWVGYLKALKGVRPGGPPPG